MKITKTFSVDLETHMAISNLATFKNISYSQVITEAVLAQLAAEKTKHLAEKAPAKGAANGGKKRK